MAMAIKRIVEVEGDKRYLSSDRGFLTVSDTEKELGRIDIDTILSVNITSRGSTISSGLVRKLAENKVPCIFCDQKFQPQSILQPLYTHEDQSKRHLLQAKLSNPLRAKIWQKIVQSKIQNQSRLLKSANKGGVERLNRLVKEVKPGDKNNVEAQAAQVYWPNLLGKSFRRSNLNLSENSFLNYGYAVLRSTTLRAIYATGLLPGFSIHHSGAVNAFCLADDLMEPYRPYIDGIAYNMFQQDICELNTQAKSSLANIVYLEIEGTLSCSPLFKQIQNLCYSFIRALGSNECELDLPKLSSNHEVLSILQNA